MPRAGGVVTAYPPWYRHRMAEFQYRCPHCGETTSVGLESLGQPCLCNHCAKPYRAEVPTAALLGEDGKPAMATASPATFVNGNVASTTRGALPDEQTVMTINPAAFRDHPLQTLLLTALVLAGLIGLLMFGGQASEGFGLAALTALCALVALGAAGFLIGQFVMTRFESLTITTQRTIWARGVIHRRSSEVQHDDIRNIQVNQNLIERLFRAGTVAISSAGQDDMEIVARGIPHPHRAIETIRTHQRRMVKGD